MNPHTLAKFLGLTSAMVVLACVAMSVRADIATSHLKSLVLTPPFTLTFTLRTKLPEGTTGAATPTSGKFYSHRIVLSEAGQTLLYQDYCIDNDTTTTVIYDGSKTYQTVSGNNTSTITVLPGFDFDRMNYAPLPAVGVPSMPLITFAIPKQGIDEKVANVGEGYLSSDALRSSEVIRDYGSVDRADHKSGDAFTGVGYAGSVSVSGVTKVLWYMWPNDRAPDSIWEFSDHQRFEGLWIANTINQRIYDAPENRSDASGTTVPVYDTREYHLQSAKATALPAASYLISAYVTRTAAVMDFRGGSFAGSIYMPGHGTLAQQEARQDVIRAAVLAKGNKPDPKPGMFLLASLLLSFATLAYWRFQETRKATGEQ